MDVQARITQLENEINHTAALSHSVSHAGNEYRAKHSEYTASRDIKRKLETR